MEIKKTRPCVVSSPDKMNKHLGTIVIAPMTSSSKGYPARVQIKRNDKISRIVIDQIRTIDKARVIKVLDSLKQKEIISVKAVVKETFVD